jgi:glyoxylase-like metal-dependent hydrolase (beta-lactamase superfamily II)
MDDRDLRDALRGLDFPAPRNKLIAKAIENGAAPEVIARIRELPETADYHDPQALKDALGVDVYMPELDARIHAGEPYAGKLRGGWPKLKTVPDHRIGHGDRIGSLEVVATPGHTPGHVSLLDTRDRSLLAGDALYTIGGLAVPDRFNLRFPLVWAATWDRAKAAESARALRALRPSLIAAGHGRATRDGIPG